MKHANLEDFRCFLTDTLPKSAQKKIDVILEYAMDVNFGGDVSEVEVTGARVPVETVTAYGLTITLDAYGNAVTVEFPYGAEVNE